MYGLWCKAPYKIKDIKMDAKTEYNKLKEKYKLPSFEYMDSEFEISAIKIPDSGIFVKAILRSIISKFALAINYLEPIVTPQQTMHSMIELNGLTEEDKKEIYTLYKQIGSILHKLYSAEMQEESKIIEQIKKSEKEWDKLKPQIIHNLDIITKSWEKEDLGD